MQGTYNVTLWWVCVVLLCLAYTNCLIPIHWKTALLWQSNVTCNSETYLGLRAEGPIIWPGVNQIWKF